MLRRGLPGAKVNRYPSPSAAKGAVFFSGHPIPRGEVILNVLSRETAMMTSHGYVYTDTNDGRLMMAESFSREMVGPS